MQWLTLFKKYLVSKVRSDSSTIRRPRLVAAGSWVHGATDEPSLPVYAEGKLHHSRIAGERGDGGRRSAADVAAWRCEEWVVRDVEDFPTQFADHGFKQRNF